MLQLCVRRFSLKLKPGTQAMAASAAGAISLRGLAYGVESKTEVDIATGLATTSVQVRFGVRVWALGARYAILADEPAAQDFRQLFLQKTGQELTAEHEALVKKNN